MKNKTKIGLIELGIGIVVLLLYFYIIQPIIIKLFPILVANLIRNGFVEIFSGNFNVSSFLGAGVLIVTMFAYIGVFLFFWFLLNVKKDYKGRVIEILGRATKDSIAKLKKYFLLIFTLILSVSLMFTGILFLSTAFPNEPLFVKGVTTREGSSLNCNGGGYQNIINTFDINCKMNLSEKFNESVLDYAEVIYSINRTEFKENVSILTKNMVILNFYKQKPSHFLWLHFTDGSEEVFPLNHAGVYTKEEYFERERDKAVWFFGIISFSLFSVFSAMYHLKRIAGWK